jgi:hypothetical protein
MEARAANDDQIVASESLCCRQKIMSPQGLHAIRK